LQLLAPSMRHFPPLNLTSLIPPQHRSDLPEAGLGCIVVIFFFFTSSTFLLKRCASFFPPSDHPISPANHNQTQYLLFYPFIHSCGTHLVLNTFQTGFPSQSLVNLHWAPIFIPFPRPAHVLQSFVAVDFLLSFLRGLIAAPRLTIAIAKTLGTYSVPPGPHFSHARSL